MLGWLKTLFGPGATDSGDRGEQLAAEWLRRERGFTVVARNWRSPRDRRDELDLVCRDADTLVFVEVKTRAAGALVPGYYAVDERKKRVLRRAGAAYLARLSVPPRTFRFDVVEVILPSDAQAADRDTVAANHGAGEPEILHFENVPLFPKNFRA